MCAICRTYPDLTFIENILSLCVVFRSYFILRQRGSLNFPIKKIYIFSASFNNQIRNLKKANLDARMLYTSTEIGTKLE